MAYSVLNERSNLILFGLHNLNFVVLQQDFQWMFLPHMRKVVFDVRLPDFCEPVVL
jgi:hypothetical protein